MKSKSGGGSDEEDEGRPRRSTPAFINLAQSKGECPGARITGRRGLLALSLEADVRVLVLMDDTVSLGRENAEDVGGGRRPEPVLCDVTVDVLPGFLRTDAFDGLGMDGRDGGGIN